MLCASCPASCHLCWKVSITSAWFCSLLRLSIASPLSAQLFTQRASSSACPGFAGLLVQEIRALTPCCRVPVISPACTVSHCANCWPSIGAGAWGAAFPGALTAGGQVSLSHSPQESVPLHGLQPVIPQEGRPDSDQRCRERLDLSQIDFVYVETDSSTGMHDSCSLSDGLEPPTQQCTMSCKQGSLALALLCFAYNSQHFPGSMLFVKNDIPCFVTPRSRKNGTC